MDTARLSLSAARLLLYLVYTVGPGIVVLKSAEEWMRAAGIGKRQTFYAARGELERGGFIAVSRRVSRGVALELIPIPSVCMSLPLVASSEYGSRIPKATNPGLGMYLPTYIRNAAIAAGEQVEETQAPSGFDPVMYPSEDHHSDVPLGGHDVPLDGTSLPTSDVPLEGHNVPLRGHDVPLKGHDGTPKGTSLSPLSQCAAADRLEGGGELTNRTSPGARRRKAQVQAIQAAWASLFPDQPALIPDRAKEMLRFSGECAEEVYETLQYVSSRKPDSPLAYALGVMRRQAREASVPAQTSAPAPPVGTPSASVTAFEKAEPTLEYLQRIREAEEIAAMMGVSA